MVFKLTACENNEAEVLEDCEIINTVETAAEYDLFLPYDNSIPLEDSGWAELRGIVVERDERQGVIKVETDTINYEFHGRTEEENINLARISEIAVSVLESEYGYSPSKNNSITFVGEEGIRVGEFDLDGVHQMVSADRIIINPDFVDSVGALFYSASGNLFPAWLSAGLELYWSDKLGVGRFEFDKDFDLVAWQRLFAGEPAFGDFYFIYTNDESRLPICFSFVKWLDDNNLLDEIVRAYLDDKQTEGDMLFADAWLELTGRDIRGDFYFENQLRYLYGHYLQTYGIWNCYRFSFLTEHGHYILDWLLPWYIVEFINNVDRMYVSAKQWLGFEDNPPIPTRLLFDSLAGATAVAEFINLPNGNWRAAKHEAFHHLLFARNIVAEFLWLNEGLPEAMDFIYAHVDTEVYAPALLNGLRRGKTPEEFAQELAALYHNLTGKEFVFTEPFDFKKYAHIKALEAVNYFIANDRYGNYAGNVGNMMIIQADDKPSDFPQGFLNAYITSASFVIYMLEIGSKEDFMRLYVDISAAEEVYGKNFNALYEQWLEFLAEL
jgi:hypothetical protein